jgi:hypothetical protein
MAPSTLLASLLLVAFRERLVAPDAETGAARVADLADQTAPAGTWLEVVVEAVRKGLVHDPVRLPQGAPQCHWHLELTELGIEAGRRLRAEKENGQ